jgi:glycosyltransferase involved in cell wall biosynthesis
MIAAFGPRALEFASRLGDLDAIVADEAHIMAGFADAVRRRERGEAFYGMVLVEQRRPREILGLASQIMAAFDNYDQRRISLDRLALGTLTIDGRPSSELWADDTLADLGVREFLSLCTAGLARSYADWALIATKMPRPRPFEVVVSEPAVPVVARAPAAGPSVVVWAPNNHAGFVAWHAFALNEFRGDVTCVCGNLDAPVGVAARFILPQDPSLERIVSAASAIVCPDPHDPGAAIAFARQGFGIVAPFSAGVHEFVRDVATYEYALKDVLVAVGIAMTRPASLRALPPAPPPPGPRGFALPAIERRPLVSVILVTYNRPADLEACLASLARQTYAPLEVVVINDCGENVDHIVARYPFARPVNLPVNGGALRALNAGFTHVRGAYVQLLADDDILYPDHIERLMAAMLATGAAVAHGNSLVRYQRRTNDDALLTVGFNTQVFADSTTPTEALKATPISGQSLIIRRDIMDRIGGFREDCVLADQEFQLRAADAYAFAYIDQTTVEWRVRGTENFSAKTNSYAGVKQVFEELHPRPDRPIVELERKAMLEKVAARPQGFIFPPSITLIETPAD